MKERIILIGTSLIFCGLWLRQCNITKNRDEVINNIIDEANVITDSIKSKKPYVEPDPLPIISKPSEVITYPKDTVKPYKELVVLKDTIRLYNNELDKFDISSDFLLQYPEAPKLLSLELSLNSLKLHLLGKSGSIIGRGYKLDLANREYLFSNHTMSSSLINNSHNNAVGTKNTIGYSLTADYQYRPLPNFHDLNINFNIETKKINYTIGVNAYNYKTEKGITPTLGIKYKLPL